MLPGGCSAALIATAVREPLCGSIPIVTATVSTPYRASRESGPAAGMPYYSAGARASDEG